MVLDQKFVPFCSGGWRFGLSDGDVMYTHTRRVTRTGHRPVAVASILPAHGTGGHGIAAVRRRARRSPIANHNHKRA
jgi:hypothetical protein